jgi:hypothetical protein
MDAAVQRSSQRSEIHLPAFLESIICWDQDWLFGEGFMGIAPVRPD